MPSVTTSSELVTMLSPGAFAELRKRFPNLENHGRVASYGRLVEFVLARESRAPSE